MYLFVCLIFTLYLVTQNVVGKCAQVGDQCNYAEWKKIIMPIREANKAENYDTLSELLIRLDENLRKIPDYDSQICHVRYNEKATSVYNYGFDCSPENKCKCGIQMLGSPTKSYEMEWDPTVKSCRRKTGQGCSEFGFVPEHQNCLTTDVCSNGICSKSDPSLTKLRKQQKYPKVGDNCNRDTWNKLYDPYLKAKAFAESLQDEGDEKSDEDNEKSDDAAEKSGDLFGELMNKMEETPQVAIDICYTADNVLVCNQGNKCECNKPYVVDKATNLCRTVRGDVCFMRCTYLFEDQCLSTDHCFTFDFYKGEGLCYKLGDYPDKKGRRARNNAAKNATTSDSVSIRLQSKNLILPLLLFSRLIFSFLICC